MSRTDETSEGSLTDDISIGVLAKMFPEAMVDAAIDQAGARETRARVLPAKLMVYLSMALWLEPRMGYERTLHRLLRGLRWARPGWSGYRVPTDGAISLARYRLGEAPLRNLFDQTAGRVATGWPEDPCALWRGLRLVALEETAFDLPPTATGPAPGRSARPGAPRSRAGLAVLAESGTLGLLGAALETPDDATHPSLPVRPLAERLYGRLSPGMLLTAGRPLATPAPFLAAAATGAQLLWRADPALALPVLGPLPGGGHRSELSGPGGTVPVRVLQDGPDVLVSTLLDPLTAPADELVRCFCERWTMDALFAVVGSDPRHPGVPLRSRSPEGVRQEFWALLCLYQALRTLTTDHSRRVCA
ncbi:transposase domain-containing protein [Kitasatospora sp. NPDC048239]|uniref:transposase domain-containing protein n=1 Tax=Kitasatospora sp. NPDC048239 TaxID=3364046 RepID=UPI00371BFEC2